MATINVEHNIRTSKFIFTGKEALGYSSDAKALVLTKREIMQIVEIFNSGTLQEMLEQHISCKKIRVKIAESHVTRAFRIDDSSSSEINLDNPKDLEDLTNKTLMSICKERGIKGYSGLKKAELLALIKTYDDVVP